MRIFKYFTTKILMKKAIAAFGVLLLLFLSDYLVFIAARSTISTLQGYKEMKRFNQAGHYIANIDPNSEMNLGNIDKKDIENVYDYLDRHFNYALFTDGFVASVPNAYDVEVSFAYLNEEYYKLNEQFEVCQGDKLYFDYTLDSENIEIPVLIGKGLSETYPLGSTITVEDPALLKQITLKVHGILKRNTYHSNLFSLSSKQYYNFSVVVPVNKDYISKSNEGFQLQGLFDIILLQTSKSEIEGLKKEIQSDLGLVFNFYTQEDNFEYYNDFYLGSLKFIAILTVLLTFGLTCITVWGTLASIRLMIKDFTINLFVGLSYSKLRMIFYGYYGILFMVNIMALFLITAYSRYGTWLRKDTSFVTFGFLHLIGMDWLALAAVLLFSIIIGLVIVEIVLWKLKRVPISLGVLQ